MIIAASHWQEVDELEWPALYFSPKECADSRDGSLLVHVPTLLGMDAIRATLNKPLQVNSWYRTPEHDAAIGGANVHPHGCAVDIGISGNLARRLIGLAIDQGFTGIGVSQKGPYANRFIHLDMLKSDGHPRPHIWSY